MSRARYALEPLVTLRRDRVDAATAALAATLRASEHAGREVIVADAGLAAHAHAAEATRASEHAALAAGGQTAGDLQRAAAWEIGVAAESGRLAEVRSIARERQADAAAAEGAARSELSAKMAEEDAVAKHRAAFVAADGKRIAAQEEEAGEEAWRPRPA
jgi:hypothetical protein